MKRLAIITPCVLPVPAVKGGAVEGLITKIIEDNEKHKQYEIDLYCLDDGKEYEFKHTNLLRVKQSYLIRGCDKVLDAIYRRIQESSSKRILDKEIVKQFSERIEQLTIPYDAVVVENHMSTALKIIKACKGRYEIPIYFHMHNNVDVYRSPKYITELVKNGVQFIAVSEYIKTEIMACDKNAVVKILYNGIDLNNCHKKENQKDTANKFLYIGRVIPGKGVRELVTAFGSFLDKLTYAEKKEYKLDIVGFLDTPTLYEREVFNLAKRYSGNINCIKKISATHALLKYYEYDAVIMPTKNMEPFGLVALEAIARGVPLIITDSGALPEVVGDGAMVIENDDNLVANLEHAIKVISSDLAIRKDISDRGYKRAREINEFNIDNYYSGFVKTISGDNFAKTVSIIVPVYNVEKYLDRCMHSLINQTYTDLEIILVNDGSTDDSGKMCDQYLNSDSRIKVIHQENQGLSAARNTGLDVAKGELVFFVDSDDYLDVCAIEMMISKMSRDQADIVACGIKKVGDIDELFTNKNPGMWSGHESVIQMMRNNNLCTVAWNKLYKRELFENIKYPIGVLHEDEATTYKLLYESSIVSYTPKPYYYYFQRDNSIMAEKVSERNDQFLEALRNRVIYFEEKSEKDLIEHSRISLLEGIKYGYRNEGSKSRKSALTKEYDKNLCLRNVPRVCGVKKTFALLLWKYLRY